MTEPGAIDCDVHPGVPDVAALLAHLETFWRDQAVERGLNSLDSNAYPLKSPLTSRPEWRGKIGLPAASAKEVGDQVFGRWQSGFAILNCLYGVQLLFSEDMAAAFCRALNDYIVKVARPRAAHARPDRDPDAGTPNTRSMRSALRQDKRFVQVLVLAMQEVPLGRRHFWPIYAACERHGLPLASMPAPLTAIR
jgi:predicted TIM-barrel fold metal-dependent hydrolase